MINNNVRELIKNFENKRPEIVFQWNDPLTEAEGWLVINSLRGGAAGGGTRMRKGLDMREVESLAKTMEIKFSISGPQIGGAKSGINFDPKDPRKKEVLTRWYNALMPILKSYYGTGGDLNVDELEEVIPITEGFGLWHPQEGVVTGHFPDKGSEKIKRIGQLRQGVSKILEDVAFSPDTTRKFTVADMITGFGVAESVRLFYKLTNQRLENKKIIIQGWGNVASGAAFYLAEAGAKIVGIIDKEGGIIQREGLSFGQVKELFLNKEGNSISSKNLLSFGQVNSEIWDLEADCFLPCAASRLISRDQAERMISAGVSLISSGANVPFADKEIFYGPIAEYVDQNISLIPDFIANCGMARVFAFLMSKTNLEISDKAIFEDVTNTIETSLKKVIEKNTTQIQLSQTAFEISLEKLI